LRRPKHSKIEVVAHKEEEEFNCDNKGSIFLYSVGVHQEDYTITQHRRQQLVSMQYCMCLVSDVCSSTPDSAVTLFCKAAFRSW
jgi:hypothetical protein